MRYTISTVEPFIQNRMQCVKVYFKERSDIVKVFSHEIVFSHLWNLESVDFELLIDSFMTPIYFQKGEQLPNGRIANSNFYHEKAYQLILKGTQEEIYNCNKNLLLNFQVFYDTHVYWSEKNRRNEVRIRSTKDDVCFCSLKKLESITGLDKNEFSLLRGAFIAPVFYKAGEVSEETSWIVYNDNTIIKNLNFRVVKNIDYNFEINGNQEFYPSSKFHLKHSMYRNNNDTNSYEKYNGYNGFNDDTIDDAFEGDPEATWNVD